MASIQAIEVTDEVAELSISGEVDAHAAAALRQLLDRLHAPVVVLDFSRAQPLHDLLFGVLTDSLDGFGVLRLHGLGEHHLRLLRYLHFELDRHGCLRAHEAQLSPP